MGFTKNCIVQEMLDLELNIFNIHFKTFDDCKLALSELRKSLTAIKNIYLDPTPFICSHFEELKLQVDLRREWRLLEVHNISKKYIAAIEIAYNDCINRESADVAATTTTGFGASIELYSEEFSKIYNNFDTLDIDGDRLCDILKLATSLQFRIQQTFDEHTRQILGPTFHFSEDWTLIRVSFDERLYVCIPKVPKYIQTYPRV